MYIVQFRSPGDTEWNKWSTHSTEEDAQETLDACITRADEGQEWRIQLDGAE